MRSTWVDDLASQGTEKLDLNSLPSEGGSESVETKLNLQVRLILASLLM